MNFEQTYKELCQLEIPEDRYYLHGIYGSTSDEDRLALTAKQGEFTIEYEIYFRESGVIGSIRTFTNENQATDYFITMLFNEFLQERIATNNNLGIMGNERLVLTGLMDLFEDLKRTNKPRATQLLKALGFDNESMESIL